MSTTYGQEIKFRHLNDCEQVGCPGHTMKAVHHNTSDTLSFEIDGKAEYWFEYKTFKAMVASYMVPR